MHSSLSFKLPCNLYVWEDASVPIQIMGDILALHLMTWGADIPPDDLPSEVLICNWKSGQLLNWITVSGICSPRFFTPTSLILIRKTFATEADASAPVLDLAIYENVGLSSQLIHSTGNLEKGQLTSMSPSVVFRLPKLNQLYSPAKDAEAVWASPASYPLGTNHSMFVPDPSSQILRLVLLSSTETGHAATPLQIFVSKDNLLHHLAKPKSSKPIIYEWQDWGESATRWLETEGTPSKRTVHGTRWVRSPHADDPSYVPAVFNFHATTVRRFATPLGVGHLGLPPLMKALGGDNNDSVAAVVKPGSLRSPLFCYTVVSRLPYLKTTLDEQVEFTGHTWRITGERLIQTPVSELAGLVGSHLANY
jgi:hypothetical protein